MHMNYKVIFASAALLCLGGCALFGYDNDPSPVAQAAAQARQDENIVPAAYAPAAPGRDSRRPIIGRPAALAPCREAAPIDALCRRRAEAHFKEGDNAAD